MVMACTSAGSGSPLPTASQWPLPTARRNSPPTDPDTRGAAPTYTCESGLDMALSFLDEPGIGDVPATLHHLRARRPREVPPPPLAESLGPHGAPIRHGNCVEREVELRGQVEGHLIRALR